MHARRRLRRWLCDKHNEPRPGYLRFPEASLHSVASRIMSELDALMCPHSKSTLSRIHTPVYVVYCTINERPTTWNTKMDPAQTWVAKNVTVEAAKPSNAPSRAKW